MPGYDILDSQLKDCSSENISKYRCPHCRRFLKDAVQPSCGHWVCFECATEIFSNRNPSCPRDDCEEELVPEDGQNFFPDRFVRREILAFMVICAFHSLGCPWEGPIADYETHKENCTYAEERCECGKTMPRTELALHKKTLCPKSKKTCPLSKLGCSKEHEMTNAELCAHFSETTDIIDHFEMLSTFIRSMKTETVVLPAAEHTSLPGKRLPAVGSDEINLDSGLKSLRSLSGRQSDEERDYVSGDAPVRPQKLRIPGKAGLLLRDHVETDNPPSTHSKVNVVQTKDPLLVDHFSRMPLYAAEALTGGVPFPKFLQDEFEKARRESRRELDTAVREVKEEYQRELDSMSLKVKTMEQQVVHIKETVKTKNAEIEDRDFRLSLIENSNYDGTMIWKIPQFSQRMTDAKTGKYTSIFSLPFYSSRYGYKMCLRLYIMGDGIGKTTHMSLFFVMMRGEFDNILPWPFTQRVTFRLINQKSGRDIVDTFQPDPLSSSFKKPKSDMNIASGCPRFISHENLRNGGFIDDDTIFIKCVVDRSTLSHP